jgi:hypothetical protein
MVFLVSLAVTSLTWLSPQGDSTQSGAARPALLSAAEQASLRDKMVKYLEAEDAYDRAESAKDRERTGKAKDKAKEAMQKEWDLRSKKGNLLASPTDLRAIYDNCFVVPPPKASLGTFRKEKDRETGIEYSFYLPKNYKADKPSRCVLVLPGTAAEGAANWRDGNLYYEDVWDKTGLLADSIVHVVHLPAGMEMDPVPDFGRDGQEAQEQKRIEAVFGSFRATNLAYNVDRARLFLDCGRGNSGFGLRFASMFPDRFAGLVLRHPVLPEGLRYGSLSGVPILLLKHSKTAAAVEELQKQLAAVATDTVTVLEVSDDYPHKAAAAEIEAWIGKQRRNMVPTRVVIEPNHDRFKKAYWVSMGNMDPLHTTPKDKRARIEVTADRTSNRIVVKARGVENFSLVLNDDLLDLDKEFTVVINDKPATEKRTRDPYGLQTRLVQRKDWEFLFTVEYSAMVPKAPANSDKPAEPGTSGDGK